MLQEAFGINYHAGTKSNAELRNLLLGRETTFWHVPSVAKAICAMWQVVDRKDLIQSMDLYVMFVRYNLEVTLVVKFNNVAETRFVQFNLCQGSVRLIICLRPNAWKEMTGCAERMTRLTRR